MKEKLIKFGLAGVALTTSLVILLIIVFLVNEGLSVFSDKPYEPGTTPIVSSGIGINHLSVAQIKDIYSEKAKNWKDVGGVNQEIKILNYDNISGDNLAEAVSKTPYSIGFAFDEDLAAYPSDNYSTLKIDDVGLFSFLFGENWYPTSEPVHVIGILPMIVGSFLVTLLAIVFAIPVGVGIAIYLSEIAHPAYREILKPILEILAGIPSVVYGFFGLVVLVPFIQNTFHTPTGESALAGAIVLAIMALPTITSISEDALKAVPGTLREGSLALGATRWQTIYKVIVPAAISGITAAIILGIGRAIGETMTVLMVTGNAVQIPGSLTDPVRTLTATIAAELGEAPQGGVHYHALFMIGFVLFVTTFVFNLIADFVSSKFNKLKS